MKKQIFAIAVFLILNNAYSQNPYFDALKLTGCIEAGKKPSLFIVQGSTADAAKLLIEKKYCDIINTYYGNKFQTCGEVQQKVSQPYINKKPNPDFNPF